MDLATIENLFTQSRDADKEVWPDLDLLRTFVQLSSEGCVPKHFALRWHVEPPSGSSRSIRYFPFPAAPGVSYGAQMEGRVNEFCRLVWDDGRHLDACISSNGSAEVVTVPDTFVETPLGKPNSGRGNRDTTKLKHIECRMQSFSSLAYQVTFWHSTVLKQQLMSVGAFPPDLVLGKHDGISWRTIRHKNT